jgi:hypothetical protein
MNNPYLRAMLVSTSLVVGFVIYNLVGVASAQMVIQAMQAPSEP